MITCFLACDIVKKTKLNTGVNQFILEFHYIFYRAPNSSFLNLSNNSCLKEHTRVKNFNKAENVSMHIFLKVHINAARDCGLSSDLETPAFIV